MKLVGEFLRLGLLSYIQILIFRAFHFQVTARDGKNSGRATVNVKVKDINDNDPKFEKQSYEAEIYEQGPPGTFVLELSASDPDEGLGGIFRFAISGQGTDAFEIDAIKGILRTRKELDREKKARYDFLAYAIDAPGHSSRRTGSTDITIIVKDVNDNRPEFPDVPYIGHVQENLGKGASVIMITAVDGDDPNEQGNAKIIYELIDDANGLFEIDRYKGLIKTRERLDREHRDEYTIRVGASDMGQPPQEGEVSMHKSLS